MDEKKAHTFPENDPEDPLYKPPVEYSSDGFHTSRSLAPIKGTLKQRRRARNAHKWTDAERQWIACAMFECNNNISEAIVKLDEYREEHGAKNVCPLPSIKQMQGLTRGVNYEAYLNRVAEGPITGQLMKLSKSGDPRVSAKAAEFLMERAKGKATARVESLSVSVKLEDQSKRALDIIKQRDKIWKNPDGQESPG